MEIDIKQILLQLLNFGILVVVLGKFTFKPLLKILDARSKKIADGQLAAEKSLKATAELEKKQAEKLAEASRKAASIINEAKAESKKLGVELINEAKNVAAVELGKQKEAFHKELETEELALKKRIADLVVETTKTVLSGTLKDSDLKAITAKEIAKLK
ncbi:F0F1 ATP synthase subunit B [Candidatus Woesebacteria bacterium]|nr:F0F1 ATP synthase subunit B [Candidatus Woesebacteria bacterium]